VALAFLPWRATAAPESLPATEAGSEGAESAHERIA